jgi:hypothetical protein
MSITLEDIEAKHSEIGDLIEKFKKQARSTAISIPAATIVLAPGETYAGIMLGEDGKPSHHLVLLPGDKNSDGWSSAKTWAAEQGGELPTRREQSLLFANLKGSFQATWYWSGEEYESDRAYAWCQYFSGGGQYGDRKDNDNCRARAVRRLVIE